MSCPLCDATGRVVQEHSGDGWRTTTSHLCACRRDLPPTQGDVAWWTTETTPTATILMALGRAQVAVETERPVSEDSRRLVRHPGNQLYPSFVEVSLPYGRDRQSMLADEARRLAAALIAAADLADQRDR